ncbi:hypothetical protein ACFX5Q_07400 [Mesorhizobium sp. IMUNJ 23033]|uniref:hypothetical protein n=1 Tax=Mesorhizobium sp. IMUNJ 23033 TaxID=3378039 RepID=UPI00384C534D
MKAVNDNFYILVEASQQLVGWYTVTVPGGGYTEIDYRSAHLDRYSACCAALDLRKEAFPHARIIEREEP